jgi:hypothetical protein
MTREEKCQLAIEKGFTYNPDTGEIFGMRGKTIIKTHNGYIRMQITFNSKKFFLSGHQFAWYWVNREICEQIDHINGLRNDNRICNLRNVTKQENQWNQTKAKGYYWHKRNNKWGAQIALNGNKIYLGMFEKEDDARQAYLDAKEKYHII